MTVLSAQLKTVEVKCYGTQTIVPAAGDIVTARITVLNQRIAKCVITSIGDSILTRVYRGVLRKEDVRATEKDRVEMYKSFRPGDIVLARVLPQTELHCYQLSTAENELGVVVAMAAEAGPYGVPMVPISWTEMQCPQTLVREPRKIAKIVPESAVVEAKARGGLATVKAEVDEQGVEEEVVGEAVVKTEME